MVPYMFNYCFEVWKHCWTWKSYRSCWSDKIEMNLGKFDSGKIVVLIIYELGMLAKMR